jgi:hypothetical protein
MDSLYNTAASVDQERNKRSYWSVSSVLYLWHAITINTLTFPELYELSHSSIQD